MGKQHYAEMANSFNELSNQLPIEEKRIYLFGHCNATEELADFLMERKLQPVAILDNNPQKWGKDYKGIEIVSPAKILEDEQEKCLVCIVARAYAAMADQLKRLGYQGQLRKLVDYNSYAEYSLSDETAVRMRTRMERGKVRLAELHKKYPGYLKLLCPFAALGDIYYMMSYLPYFLRNRTREKCVIGVIGNACAKVVKLFGEYPVEVFTQKDMDEIIQAALATTDELSFIPHQDRPYVVNLHKALYVKCIPLELIYKCGVFGLPRETMPYPPVCWRDYPYLRDIMPGKAVIFSPYAKSVTTFDEAFWRSIVTDYLEQGFQCFTNVAGEEEPLEGTVGISPQIAELKSVLERAGTFIGIRSGLCDVIRYAECRKLALYPDYYYSDTQWKAIDMYALEGWENIVVDEDFVWNRN